MWTTKEGVTHCLPEVKKIKSYSHETLCLRVLYFVSRICTETHLQAFAGPNVFGAKSSDPQNRRRGGMERRRKWRGGEDGEG
jgi:hypothetical protein